MCNQNSCARHFNTRRVTESLIFLIGLFFVFALVAFLFLLVYVALFVWKILNPSCFVAQLTFSYLINIQLPNISDSIPIKRHFKFEKNQFLVIVLESSIDKGMYVITSEFSGEYAADLRGMYKASFKYKNGTDS